MSRNKLQFVRFRSLGNLFAHSAKYTVRLSNKVHFLVNRFSPKNHQKNINMCRRKINNCFGEFGFHSVRYPKKENPLVESKAKSIADYVTSRNNNNGRNGSFALRPYCVLRICNQTACVGQELIQLRVCLLVSCTIGVSNSVTRPVIENTCLKSIISMMTSADKKIYFLY